MSSWKQLRILVLAVTFSSTLFVLGNIILAIPNTGNNTTFDFPSQIPLPGWQPLASHSLTQQAASNQKSPPFRKYQYSRNRIPLDIEMRYIINTNGDIKLFVRIFTAIVPSSISQWNTRHSEGVGFYSLFTYQGKAYLSACINPRGESTVTNVQFVRNRRIHDAQPSRILPWLLRQEPLIDNRCLWALLAVPAKDGSSEDAYPILETVWKAWYSWWAPRFPKP